MKLYSIFETLGSPAEATPRAEADEDDDTVVASENRTSNERETREICLKWVFPMTNDKRRVLQGHCTVLTMMLKAHPELVIIDNKAREHTDKKTIKSTERNRPFEFHVDQRNQRNRTMVCIHRIRSQKSLAELKSSWGAIEELQKHKAYVRTHAFGEKDREISHLGFIPGINMSNTSKDCVKEEIMTRLREENGEVPNFEIVQVGVDMGRGSNLMERTRAYEIQCVQKEASRLAKMLQKGQFQTQPVYIPYRLKKTDPKTFKGAIKQQIRILADQWVIKVQGFTHEMIQHIQLKLSESKIEGIVPTQNANKGEWKLLINRHQYGATMKWLKANWEDIIHEIPGPVTDASPHDYPKIASKNSETVDQESEEGTVDTYGTILSSLYYGADEDGEVKSDVSSNESTKDDLPQNHPVTYAQVTKETTSTVSQVSGWTDHKNEELAQLQENNTRLQDQLNTVTAELGELKHLLQQLILVQNRPPSEQEPPTKKQATFETPERSERRSNRTELQTMSGIEPTEQGSEPGQSQDMDE